MSIYSAPAKIILYGEHAVVYGTAAIAAPIPDLRAFAITRSGEAGQGLVIRAIDSGHELSVDLAAEVDDALVEMAQRVLRHLNVEPPDALIELRSDIPIASGLGSGAAISTALARALAACCGQTLSREELNGLVYALERRHHGTPSGIDNTVVVYETPILFRNREDFEPFRARTPLRIVIGDTGIHAPTKESVGDVRRLYNADPQGIERKLRAIGVCVESARRALEIGDLVSAGHLMVENHMVLRELTVSSIELDRLVEAALGAGALGAKMSGGGRGGNMIALVTAETEEGVRAALEEAGAVRVWVTEVR
ncbi:MAG: mevalonate kinase [Anaerolineae bacterium]|nr:mevalonate kinase [Anaerolineae bacterium]